jgi:transposase
MDAVQHDGMVPAGTARMHSEDARRLHRERQRLVRERTGHLNRIKALMIT